MRRYLGRAALAGMATGLRSTVGIGALINARAPGLPGSLTWLLARIPTGIGVAAELVGDKLPSAPSRLERRGLTGRLVFAGAAGAILARGARRPVLPAVLIASGTALVSARVGHDIRVAAAQRFPPLVVALVEDVLALGLAAAASRG